jgi:hypothetical protein
MKGPFLKGQQTFAGLIASALGKNPNRDLLFANLLDCLFQLMNRSSPILSIDEDVSSGEPKKAKAGHPHDFLLSNHDCPLRKDLSKGSDFNRTLMIGDVDAGLVGFQVL